MESREVKRDKRRVHIRKKVVGSSVKPRVFVKKTNKYMYVGSADDDKGIVLKSFRVKKGKVGATEAGKKMADWLKKNKVEKAVFDRSGYKYHGVLDEVAKEIRKEIKL